MVVRYVDIADELRGLVGDSEAGSTLPKQADLAAQFGVNIKTIRAAIGLLREEGLVIPVRRRGTVITDGPVDWRARALAAEARLAAVERALRR